MQESSNARVISLLLAISVVIAGWLLFEYGNQSAQLVSAPTELNPNPLPTASPPGQAITRPNQIPSNLAITYKCEKNGKLSFSDQPCTGSEKALSVTAVEKENSTPNGDLRRLKEKVAVMEAERHERERPYAVNVAVINNNADHASKQLCESIDKRIEFIDAQLRLPHSGQSGDILTAERKKANDEKYSLGC